MIYKYNFMVNRKMIQGANVDVLVQPLIFLLLAGSVMW
jgi:hypothetical protein